MDGVVILLRLIELIEPHFTPTGKQVNSYPYLAKYFEVSRGQRGWFADVNDVDQMIQCRQDPKETLRRKGTCNQLSESPH